METFHRLQERGKPPVLIFDKWNILQGRNGGPEGAGAGKKETKTTSKVGQNIVLMVCVCAVCFVIIPGK